ncbi:RNA-directed DNA polymerase from mobile element jockey [Trichonephila clavipes]|nr:RNA-directed DNA polymerase from mobile element jockey [Trichonephila clavipes]
MHVRRQSVNLLVNLGEEELKDYESLKQVVLKEYEPSPKICLENFRKAKRNSDETFSQFASRLTSMWLYYCKLRGANDFESVNQLIVADKMFEMLDSETATHIGVLQGEEWYKPRDLGKQCDIFYASKGKSFDEPERAKWNDSEKRSFNGSWGKQPFGEKKSDNFSSRKNFDQGTELEDGTVTARVDLLGKVIPRRAIEDKLSKLVKTSISVDGKLVHALVDSGTEITVIKKDLVPGISVEGASTIYLKGIFVPAVKCPLVYVPVSLATGGQINVVHQQVLCAWAEVLVEDVLLPPDVLAMLGGAQSEENSLALSSQDLRVDSGNVDETEVSSGILPEKAQEHIEDSQRNITSCRNEAGTLGIKDEEVTAEMDKGSILAECCAELALAWKYAKEGKGNYYEVDGYLFHRDKILGESIGQLVILKCRRTEVLSLAHISVFSSHMGPKKTLERIKYSFFWEGLRADVKKFCESCKECQLTRSVRIKDRSPITPVSRPELPFEVVNMDLIGPIDPPSSKGHKCILCLVDQHTRWGEAMPVTSLSAKVICEALLSIFSRTEIYLLLKGEGFVERNSAASWVTVLDLWKWYFCRSLTKKYAACVMSFGIYMTKKVRFKFEYTSYGCGACKEPLPAPGNRSNKRRYREKDLAMTVEKKGRNGGEKESGGEETGVVKRRHGWTMDDALCANGYFPPAWKHAIITLLPKPGKNAKFATNYRPISLLSTIGKIFEKIILKRLQERADSHNLIPDFQHGFRSETSTNHQLLRLTNRVINGFNNGDTTEGAFLDVEKAFDRVWHDGLIFKMIKLNFPSYIIHLINSYLNDRTFQVKILATLSRIGTVSAENGVLKLTSVKVKPSSLKKDNIAIDNENSNYSEAASPGEANPQVYVETPLHQEKLTVWCALWAGGIIGPYFFKDDEGHNVTVNGVRYRAMIINFFIPELKNHDVQELWFQQDGATYHTARATIDLLKDTFGDRLISRFGPVNWPPRSCDLSPLDYFLWGYVTSLVYANKPQTLDHLEDNICNVIVDIRPQMLEKVIENWTSRLDYIRASRDSHMPEIIFKM